MTREFRTFIALSAIAVSIAALPALGADNGTMVRVTVPFAFTAGTASLPAGEYVVSQQSGNHVLTIAGKGGDAILMSQPAWSTLDLNSSTLTFERTDKGNKLTEVNIGGSASNVLKARTVAGK
jgi:hypothetical protein